MSSGRLVGGEAEELSDAELVGRLDRLERRRRQTEAETAALLAEVARRELPARDGLGSVGLWAQHRFRLSRGEATARVRTMKLLGAEPDLAETCESATIGVEQVRELARAHANPRCGHLLTEALGELVADALRLPMVTFRARVRGWERLADQDGAFHEEDLTHEGRHVSVLPDLDGGVSIRGRLGSYQGAIVQEVLGRFEQAEFMTDLEKARTDDGPEIDALRLPRTPAQRRADAFVAMCQQAAAAAPGATAAEPLVNVVVDLETFERHLAAAFGAEPGAEDPARYGRVRCATGDGSPLDPRDVVAAAMVGRIRRVVVDGAGVVIDAGRKRRLFTKTIRELLATTMPGCIWPTCRVPGWRCQVDHVVPWRARGPTDAENAALCCGGHNRLKERGFRVWRDPLGDWHFHRPDGTEITSI